MATTPPDLDEQPELPTVELLDGFGTVEEAVAERAISTGPRWRLGAVIVAAVAIVAVVVSVVGGDDEPAPPTTTPSPTTAAPPTTIPVRTTLAPPQAAETSVTLPGVRPAAGLVGLSDGAVFTLDLATGETATLETPVALDRLFLVGESLLGLDGRELIRIDPDGTVRSLAQGVSQVERGYGPDSVVSVNRDGSGVVARVLGPDGVFRAGARLPGEAVVYGAVADHLVVGVAGRVLATTGQENSTVLDLGSGRVVGLGVDRVARLVCDLESCRIVLTDLAGAIFLEVPLPEILSSVSAQRWSRVGWLSPSGERLMVELTQGNGSVRGAVVVDLVTGVGQHSPELGIDFDTPAWSPDSRFVLYPFDSDVFVWDLDAAPGQLRSARAILGVPITDIYMR